MNAINEMGLRIPDDVSAIGYDGISLADIVSPKLTTYCQNTAELGARRHRDLLIL